MRKIVEHFENVTKIIVNPQNGIMHIPQLEILVDNFHRTWVEVPERKSEWAFNGASINTNIELGKRLTDILKQRVLKIRQKFNYYD